MRRTENPPRSPSLSHDFRVLYAASAERMVAAELLFVGRHWALSMYVSGLAVETLLQAYALKDGAVHDAGHDLKRWLTKCPDAIISGITVRTRDQWSVLSTLWSNELRYLSNDGLLGRIRAKEWDRGVRGDREAVLKAISKRCLDSARAIHQ